MYNADNETTREEMYKSNVSLPPAEGATDLCKHEPVLDIEKTDIHYPYFCAKCNCKLKEVGLSKPQPTAEGAETIQPHITCPKCSSTNNSELAKNDRLCYDCNHSWSEQQPTAEGAEEYFLNALGMPEPPKHKVILPWYDITALMHDFATLHAQQIADKMVSERLGEEKK